MLWTWIGRFAAIYVPVQVLKTTNGGTMFEEVFRFLTFRSYVFDICLKMNKNILKVLSCKEVPIFLCIYNFLCSWHVYMRSRNISEVGKVGHMLSCLRYWNQHSLTWRKEESRATWGLFLQRRWLFVVIWWILCSVAESCLTLCDPMDCSMSGFLVLHHLLELAQTCPSSWWCHPTINLLKLGLSFE